MLHQNSGEMSLLRVNLADHVEDHGVLSPEEAVLGTSPGTESSYPRLPQSLNDSGSELYKSLHIFLKALDKISSYLVLYNGGGSTLH